jgi:hypothetical protein
VVRVLFIYQVKMKLQGQRTVAQVLYFSVAQAVKQEGSYACGSVWVQLLPEEVHGATKVTVPLRRLDGVFYIPTSCEGWSIQAQILL